MADPLETAKVGEPAPSLPTDDDINLTAKQEERLATYLMQELIRSQSETKEFRDKVILWRDFIDPRPTTKSFPWEGASSVFMPIPRMILDAFKATFKQSIWRQKDVFVSTITSPEHAGIQENQMHDANLAASKMAEYLARDPGHINLEFHMDGWIEEMLTTGIGPIKLIVEQDIRPVVVKGKKQILVTVRNGPRLFVVPVGTWVWPAGLWNSVQEMPWVGNWTVLTSEALRLRKARPWNYKHIDEVIENVTTGIGAHGEDYQNRLEKIGQLSQEDPGHQIYEIYLHWRLNDTPDAPLHDLLVTYSLKANKILRARYNPAGDGSKPYDVEVASPRSATIFGRGIIEPIVQPVRGINTAINQTFDSMTLANAPIILYPEDSTAGSVLAGGFAPGISLPYKEDKAEIDVLKLPDPSATSFALVNFFQNVIERLTRITPSNTGDVASGKRVPATLGMQSMQQSAELIDEMIDRLRNTVGRIMSRAFVLYNEHDPGIFERVLGPEKGALLKTIVDKSVGDSRNLYEILRLRLTASSTTRSIELERQNTMATAQLLFAWYEKAIGLVQLYFQSQLDPTMAPTAKEILLSILKAAQEQMKRIVELANTPDAQLLVPDIAAMIEQAAPMMPPMTPPMGPAMAGGGGMPPEMMAMMQGGGGGGAPGPMGGGENE